MVKRGVKGVAIVEVKVKKVKKLRFLPMNVAVTMKGAKVIKTAKNTEEMREWLLRKENREYRKRLKGYSVAEKTKP